VLMRRGSDVSIFRVPHDSWLERRLTSGLGRGGTGGRVVLTHSETLCDQPQSSLINSLRVAGWRIVAADCEPILDVLHAVRDASLVTLVDDRFGALLVVASQSASVQEIQLADSFQPTDGYKTAMAKSLAYSVSLVPNGRAADWHRVAQHLAACVPQLLSAHVDTFASTGIKGLPHHRLQD
jgi:hypothetical protein